MDNRPIKKKARNRAFAPILKHIKKYLYYEREVTTKLNITKREAIDLFLHCTGNGHITKNKQDFLLDLYFDKGHPLLDDIYISVLQKKIRDKDIPPIKLKYKDYLRSEQWRKKRQELFNTRGRCCERCGIDLGELGVSPDVHHKTYKNLFNEPLEDLEVLCRPCHKKHHGK